MEQLDILKRNTDEIVKEGEVEGLLEKDDPRAYVGYETSGPVHLGHWMSIRKLLDAEQAGFEPVVLLADKHTFLNKKGDEEWSDEEVKDWIDDMTDYWQTTFEGLGLEDAEFVRGREIQDTREYDADLWDLGVQVTDNRAKRSMGEIAGDGDIHVAQLNYPLMQSLDIPHLDVDLAIGGTDQRKIHMLARDKLPDVGYDSPTAMHYPLLTSLKGEDEKMSSSKPDTMFALHEDPGEIERRIRDAYCPPEADLDKNPVMQISKYFIFGADEELYIAREDRYGGDVTYSEFDELAEDLESGDLHPEDLKGGVASYVSERLRPVREQFRENPEQLQPLEEIGFARPDYVADRF